MSKKTLLPALVFCMTNTVVFGQTEKTVTRFTLDDMKRIGAFVGEKDVSLTGVIRDEIGKKIGFCDLQLIYRPTGDHDGPAPYFYARSRGYYFGITFRFNYLIGGFVEGQNNVAHLSSSYEDLSINQTEMAIAVPYESGWFNLFRNEKGLTVSYGASARSGFSNIKCLLQDKNPSDELQVDSVEVPLNSQFPLTFTSDVTGQGQNSFDAQANCIVNFKDRLKQLRATAYEPLCVNECIPAKSRIDYIYKANEVCTSCTSLVDRGIVACGGGEVTVTCACNLKK